MHYLNSIIIFPCIIFTVLSSHASLHRIIDTFVKKNQLIDHMGLAVGIIKNNKMIYFKGFGYANRDKKIPITQKTIFPIGSNTKAFTSLMLNILVDQNILHLEKPIISYLPKFKLSDPYITQNININDILSHRTGIPRHDYLYYVSSFTREDILYRLEYLPLNQHEKLGFREGFQYNNIMYMVAGLILENVLNKEYESLIQDEILDRLEMNSTYMNIDYITNIKEKFIARPYVLEQQVPFKDIKNIAPAGSMASNVEDLVKWINFQLNFGKNSLGEQLISKEQLLKMWEPITKVEELFEGNHLSYGLGWFINTIKGKKIIWHGGNIDGHSTLVSFIPEEKLGLIILNNQNGNMKFESPVLTKKDNKEGEKYLPYIIYDYLLEQKIPLKNFIGTFSNPAYGNITISEEKKEFYINYYSQRSLITWNPDRSQFEFYFTIFSHPEYIDIFLINKNEIQISFEKNVPPMLFARNDK